MDAADMGEDLAQVLITEKEIGQRLDEMAAQIDADYEGKDLEVVFPADPKIISRARDTVGD